MEEIIKGNNFTTEIKVGQKWQVFSNHFMAFHRLKKHKAELIPAFSEFEIMHLEEWHFRLDDGRMFFAKPHEILEHCKIINSKKSTIDSVGEISENKRQIRGANIGKQYKKSVRVESIKKINKHENIRD